jgi:tetratricopeptide (TPR) repeat protein
MESIKWAFTATVSNHWHPLTLLSHTLDWTLFGANASGHHLISLLLHIGAVLFLFFFLEKTTKSFWLSAFAAALFALHPLRVESVAWTSSRKDVLSMFFGMAALHAYALYVQDHRLSKYFFCLILFALGLLAKPILVTLPFVLMLIDYWPLERWQKALNFQSNMYVANTKNLAKEKRQNKQSYPVSKNISASAQNSSQSINSLLWEKVPFIILSILSSIVTIWAQSKGGAIASLEKLPLVKRLSNAVISYVSYLGKTFWPVDLAVFYPYEQIFPLWQVLGGTLLLLAISTATIFFIKKAAFLFVGWFWFLGTLVPVIGLLQVSIQPMADRYTYLPSIGIAIMLVWGVAYLLSKVRLHKIIIMPAAIILAALTFLTWRQCGYWENSVVLFERALQITKNNDLAHSNLGASLATQGKIEEATAHYLAAIKINPAHQEAHSNLGIVLAAQGRNEEAIAHYLAAIRINPNYDDAYYNLANLLMKQGKIEEAVDSYRKVIKINPDHFEAHCNLADTFVKQNKIDQAIEHFREAVRINPSSFASLNNLGVNLERQLKHDEAIYYYRQALFIESQNPGIHFNLGVAFGNKGDLREAIEHFRVAINLKPDYDEARQALKLAQKLDKGK